MITAIASGKGGTGKTTIAVNLALNAVRNPGAHAGQSVYLIDCDVEAPNAALFLEPVIDEREDSTRLMPVFEQTKCDGCGECAQVCTYNAIAVAGGKVLFFKELCHACGSCALNCPQAAIQEEPETIGLLESGSAGELRFAQGTLSIGFSSPVPVIRDLKKWALPNDTRQADIFLDTAPGCTCPVVETLRGVDFVLLVTEPTPFGLHDLKLVVELAKDKLNLPCGVVINKSGERDAIIEDFCRAQDIPILMRLPLSRQIAETYAEGELLIDASPQYRQEFAQLYESIHVLAADQQGAKL